MKKMKKGAMEDFIKILLWVILFAVLLVAVYFIIRGIT